MTDKLTQVFTGEPTATFKRLRDMGDGTFAEVVASGGNFAGKFRDAFESYTPGQRWTQAKASGDLIHVDGNAAAASYLVISKNPLQQATESFVESIGSFTMPAEVAIGLSLSQRTLGQEFSVEIVDTEEPLAAVPDIAIASISQTTTTLTVTTAVPHGLGIGKSIGIRGVSDARLNYPALVIASVPALNQFTCTAGPGGTIASVTAGPFTSGAVFFRQRMGRANDGVSMIFENATATNASFYTRSESGDAYPSGSIVAAHSLTIGTTAPVQLVNSAFTYAFGPTTEYRLNVQSDRVQMHDSAVDVLTGTTGRFLRTSVVPSPDKSYKLRFRATNSDSLTVPVAQIVSMTKSGTTTATVVCDRPHGLATGDPVVTYGTRDQAAANFPNLTAATTVTVVDASTFTVTIGTGTTGTTFGGYVAKVLGGNLMSTLGAIAQAAQNATLSTLSDGTRQLVLIGSAAWAGLSIGDTAELVGVRNNVDGASLGVDGPWKVANASTTTLTLVNLPGVAGLPADFTATDCGGGLIKRSEIRISFVRIFDFGRDRVEFAPRPTADITGSVPTYVTGGTLTGVSAAVAGSVAVDAAIGNPVTAGLRASNANITAMSAAGDSVGWLGTMIGAGVVKPFCLPEAQFDASLALTTTTAAAVAAAAGAGIKRHLVAMQAINTGASAVDLIILDGATERWRMPLPPNVPVDVEFPTHLSVTANTALNANLSAAGTVRANFQGYTAP